MKNLFTFFCLLILSAATAQPPAGNFAFRQSAGPEVRVENRTLVNPWAGGLNGAQYSRIHLNPDAVEDLVVFDRQTNRITAFVAEPQGTTYRWKHAPEYESQFPADILYWMLLVDYDRDGRKDLFTHTPSGLRIFKNTAANGRLAWQSVADPVYGEGLSSRINLYIVSTDVPGITDADDDGDIDIITFDITGNAVEFWQNMAKERGKGADALEFKKQGFCWGGFQKEYCNDFVFGIDCGLTSGRITDPNARPMHAGNSILLLDVNGDKKKDVLFGHVSCRNIARLNNTGGNGAASVFTSFSPNFPDNNPIDFDVFPAVYLEDLDFDGQRDLVASPNVYTNDADLIDFRNSNWFYRNAGTDERPDFQYVQKNFLQDGMIDVGEDAAPLLADLDGDGDLDLLIGNAGIRGNLGVRASLTQYENTGTAAQPVFQWRTDDYLNLSGTFQVRLLQAAMADMDGNGSPDLVFSGTNVNRGIDIRYLPNAAARGAAPRFDLSNVRTITLPDRVGLSSVLNWVDVDGDGRTDLLAGVSAGGFRYFRNTGSSTPQFQLVTDSYGRIPAPAAPQGASLALVDFNGDAVRELLVGDNNGTLKLYRLPQQPDAAAQLLDSTLVTNSLTQTANEGVSGGLFLATADLTGDGLPDVLAGTTAGGLRFLQNTSEKSVVTGNEPTPAGIWAFPNPTDRYVRIVPPQDGVLTVLSATGKTMTAGLPVRQAIETTLDFGGWAAGLYIVQLRSEKGPVRRQKIMLVR
ncbi:T9SS type A sorting domain-containing protein [Tellurirhabdus rosea]|uniref:T9SS type A sorting domain-containing protein n=1 Tax=Tellurirhabdus rosea TaxID=2674997 RepID=UPI002257CF90|nr:T9SS type A sorting domain-containing protein [Tellurirhabdus rosea]